MHARVTKIRFPPNMAAEVAGVAHGLAPILNQQRGFNGLQVLTDRHLGEANRIGKLRSQLCQLCLSHPTGNRTGASDVNRYLKVTHLLYELPERREAHPVHGIDHPRLR